MDDEIRKYDVKLLYVRLIAVWPVDGGIKDAEVHQVYKTWTLEISQKSTSGKL